MLARFPEGAINKQRSDGVVHVVGADGTPRRLRLAVGPLSEPEVRRSRVKAAVCQRRILGFPNLWRSADGFRLGAAAPSGYTAIIAV